MGLKIIAANDDGFDAPGLAALVSDLESLADVVVVAPEAPQSWISHKVTVREPIRVEEVRKNWFKISGTPADCSRIALKIISPDAQWLVAGINPGANLGSDVYNSGTVAAAREASILGCRAIAVSQYISAGRVIDWKTTGHHAVKVIRKLMDMELNPGRFWNVNLPHPLDESNRFPTVFCPLDTNPHHYTFERRENQYMYTGSIHDRPRDRGKDVDVCFTGNISVTLLSIDADCPQVKPADLC